MRVLEIAAFVTLSGALHVAALTIAPFEGGGSGGGEGGANDVSLQAATPTLAAMVADWDRPPQVSAAPELAVPTTDAAPMRPVADSAGPAVHSEMLNTPVASDSAPDIDTRLPAPPVPFAQPAPDALPVPDMPRTAALPPSSVQPDRPKTMTPAMQPLADQDTALPQVDSTPPPGQHAPTASLRPEDRPAVQSQPAPTRTVQPSQTARGAGQQKTATAAPARRQPAASGPSKAQLTRLEQQWGAQITNALRRAHRPPGGNRATGTVQLVLSITPAGQVTHVSVVTPSGNARLDQAALSAVRRARFPRAPEGLTNASYKFSQRLTVAR